MNFEQKNGGEHCTEDNSPQDVFHCDADENEFAGLILKNLPLVRAVVLSSAAELCGAGTIVTSGYGVREGYLEHMLERDGVISA